MKFSDLLFRLMVKLGIRRSNLTAAGWAVPANQARDWAKHARTELAKMFLEHRGREIHKWLHYLDIYDSHFARLRTTGSVRLLEIGVRGGGSLELWQRYFGDDATICGIDIDPACAARVTAPTRVRIGSQDDPEFLAAVVTEMGGLDIVIDDGSHIGRHQYRSFETLFPLLAEGGVYIIEDLHTSYWPGHYEGGFGRSGTAIALLKELMDAMHAPFHGRPGGPAQDWVQAIHLHNWTVVIEKRRHDPMGHFRLGTDQNPV